MLNYASMSGTLVVLTGASGSGKTTIARRVEAEAGGKCEVHFFDSVGVPTPEQMIAEFGSGEAWQRATTFAWMERIAAILLGGRSVLLEGQIRIAFLQEALHALSIRLSAVILVDCDDGVRVARLREERGQPELANEDMLSWAAYLRQEARTAGVEVLDTGKLTVNESALRMLAEFG